MLEVDSVSAANATSGDGERFSELLDVDTGTAATATAGESERVTGLLEVDTGSATNATAGDSERISGLLEVPQLAEIGGAAEPAVHATAGESEEILGLHVSPSSLHNSSNSRGCVAAVACARLLAVPGVSARVCPVSSSSAVSAAVAHARFTPMRRRLQLHILERLWVSSL